MPPSPQHRPHPEVQQHISPARFQPYLDACGGSAGKAFALYRWNIEMSGAFYEALGIVEVILRNAIDRELQKWNPTRSTPQKTFGAEWVRDPASPLFSILNPTSRNGQRKSTYDSAKYRAENDSGKRLSTHPRHRLAVTHDDVVAHITFGTWNMLLPGKQPNGIGPGPQRGLWNGALVNAFPQHPDPVVIKYWVERLHHLRNRIAHLEPLISLDLLGYHRSAVRLLKAIDPAVGDWYSGISKVPAVIKSRP